VRNLVAGLRSKLTIPSPISSIFLQDVSRTLFIKRDDLIHPEISGNKWRKLKGYLSQFDHDGLLSLGGAFSNHLHAAASVCRLLSIPFACFVRGKEVDLDNPTLRDIHAWGGEIIPLSRSDFRSIRNQDVLPTSFEFRFSRWQFIPEGGRGVPAFEGIENLARELMDQMCDNLDVVVLPVGSGTTVSGLRYFLPSSVRVVGVRVVKDAKLKSRLKTRFPFLSHAAEFDIIEGYEWRGFGRYNQDLLNWMDHIFSQYQLSLDLVYNSKALYAVFDMFAKQQFSRNERVVYIHTGGLQGNRSLAYCG
jgi:1-aminocyclopropane-1-carboxylate deaminase